MLDKFFNALVRGGTGEVPSLDAVLEPLDAHLKKFETLVEPSPDAKLRTSFKADIPREDMSMVNLSALQRLKFLSRGLPLFLNMQKSARMYDGKFKPKQDEASPEFIAELERRAFEMGASDIAYVEVPTNAIFKDKGIPHKYAVVFTVEMDKEPIDTSPSFESQYEVVKGYKNLAVIGNKLAMQPLCRETVSRLIPAPRSVA